MASAPTPRRRIRALPLAAILAVSGVALALWAGADRAAPAPPASTPASGVAATGSDAAPLASAPPPAPAAPAAPAVPAPPAPAGPEDRVMERLREVVDVQPQEALRIADEGDAAFPGGAHAAERSYLRMRALVHLGDIGQARAVADDFFERHPGDPLARAVFRLTGMRPRPHLGPPS